MTCSLGESNNLTVLTGALSSWTSRRALAHLHGVSDGISAQERDSDLGVAYEPATDEHSSDKRRRSTVSLYPMQAYELSCAPALRGLNSMLILGDPPLADETQFAQDFGVLVGRYAMVEDCLQSPKVLGRRNAELDKDVGVTPTAPVSPAEGEIDDFCGLIHPSPLDCMHHSM